MRFFEDLTVREIAESIAAKPEWAAEMFVKCMEEKHMYKGNAGAFEELCRMKEAELLKIRSELASIRCDLKNERGETDERISI